MSLKDTARQAAILSTLHTAIGDQLKDAKKELEAGLRAAKAETGTQKISLTLDEGGPDIGSVSLVQPKAAAAVTNTGLFTEWVRANYEGEIKRQLVTTVQPGFQKKLLDQMTAAGVAEWSDPETGVIHEVPGVEMQGRAAHTRMTIPDAGKAAIAEAWREGRLAATAPPALTSGPGEDTAKLQARLAELEERDAWLCSLEAAGVDNWSGYDTAREIHNGGAE